MRALAPEARSREVTRKTPTPRLPSKPLVTPPATRSSTQPSLRSEDAETPTLPHAENSAPAQSPHSSPAPASAPHTSYPPPPDAPSPPHALESGVSSPYRSSRRAM